MRTWNIAIAGGGPGGLMTAYFIQKWADDPFRITLFEAGDRLGGKILTPSFRTIAATYEAGAAEIYDYSHLDDDPLKELIEELGLPITRMEGSAAMVRDRTVANVDDLGDLFGPTAVDALRAFDHRARDQITPQEFYTSDPDCIGDPLVRPGFDAVLDAIRSPHAREFVARLINSDLATEPAKTSVAYGLHNYLMNDHTYMSLYSIAGGNEALPRELARRLNAETRLGHRVTAVAGTANGSLRVTAECGNDRVESLHDMVVLALPHTALRGIAFPNERLAAAMARHRADYDFPAHYLRITIAFRQKFWAGRLNESYCMLDQFGGCCLYDESSREADSAHAVLGWLIAGATAESMSGQSDDELIAAALAALPAALAHGRVLAQEGRVHRWVAAVNALPGGLNARTLDRRHQPEPIDHPNLFAVGDYMSDSTLNGLLDSAEYVAMWTVARMAERPGANS